jgi:hypothetical protein
VTPPRIVIPKKPVPLDEVMKIAPEVRQSVLSKMDDCPLSAYLELKMTGFNTHPQGAGIIFHRVAAEILREIREMDSDSCPPEVGVAILEEALEQKDVPPEDRIRVPMRDVPLLRMTVVKFCRDNRFSTRHIVDIEQRISAPLEYTDAEGEVRERILTGQLDVLIADPARADAAIVVDWKNTWALPPDREAETDEEDHGKLPLSYHGYFQQRFYGWLVMKVYPSMNYVTLREFYPRRSQARKATISRKALPAVEDELRRLVRDFDRSVSEGAPRRLRMQDVGSWVPQPGKHCGFCAAPQRCPIEADAREKYVINTPERARRAVAELQVAEAVRANRREGLRPWVEANGPVTAKWSKGRLVFGLYTQKNGKPVLRFFTPTGEDRPPARSGLDRGLEDALRRSAAAIKAGA